MALTFRDLQEIRKVVEEVVDERTRLIPTRDELFSRLDETMGELKNARDERAAMFAQYERVEEDVRKLKTIHPQSRHGIATA